jgi:arylformamidase
VIVVRVLLFALACAGLVLSAGVQSQASRGAAVQRAAAVEVIAYGTDPLQALDYWPGRTARSPLVVFVHGGGWSKGDKRMMRGSDKLRHWQAQGYAVASLNYRLVPEATVEQQAEDVAAAVALLKARFAPRRIALVGHSAGAHLVALVGTDPAYLRTAGLTYDDIAGVVPLDGAAYDVPAQLGDGPRIMGRMYRQAFGGDEARQARLSPTAQAGAPNAAEFLILHVQRDDGVRQSARLAAELRKAGTGAEVRGFSGTGLRGHAEINRRMGDPDYPATAVLDGFLAKVLFDPVTDIRPSNR